MASQHGQRSTMAFADSLGEESVAVKKYGIGLRETDGIVVFYNNAHVGKRECNGWGVVREGYDVTLQGSSIIERIRTGMRQVKRKNTWEEKIGDSAWECNTFSFCPSLSWWFKSVFFYFSQQAGS